MRNDAIKKHHFAKPTSPPLTLMNSFLKSPRPSLPLKRAPPLSPSPFPLRGQGMCQPPYSVLKPLRYKVGGPSEVFASSGAAVCGMRPHGYKSLTGCLVLARCLLGTCSKLFRKSTWISLTLMNSFLKSPRPSLPLKRAPPLSPSPFPLRGQGMCQPPYSVLKPLRYKVGGPSEVFASSRAAVCGMRPHGYKSLSGCLVFA